MTYMQGNRSVSERLSYTRTHGLTHRDRNTQQTQRETITHGGKSQPQGHNRSQDTGHGPRGCGRREKCTQTGTVSATQEHSLVHKDSLTPKDATYVPAQGQGQATSGPGLVGLVHDKPLACQLQVGLDGLAWLSLQSLPTGEQPRGRPGSLWASALGS